MAKKVKTEEVKTEAVKEPISWIISDDMMSITFSDGRKGKALDCGAVVSDCDACMSQPICGKSVGIESLRKMFCSSHARADGKNIVWVDAKDEVALPPVSSGVVEHVRIHVIHESPYQIRVVDTQSDSFNELVASVKANGLINPITVRVRSDLEFELIAGHRRFNACLVANAKTVPCYVLSVDDKQAEAMTCCENLNREDLLPIDEALTVKAMLDHGRTREEIAKITGKSTRWVYRREAAARIGAEWIQLAKTHKLSSKFLELIGSVDENDRTQALEYVRENEETLEDGGDINQIRWNMDFSRRNLRNAPWRDDFDWCEKCERRSDMCQGMEEDGSATCLDGACWKRQCEQYPESMIERYRKEGIEVKEIAVTDEDLDMMDMSQERDEDYDVCVLRKHPFNSEMEILWARSKPMKQIKQQKQQEKKPTEENLIQAAFCEILTALIADCQSRCNDNKTSDVEIEWVRASLIVGMSASYPDLDDTSSWINSKRATTVAEWFNATDPLNDDGEVKEAFMAAVRECIDTRLKIWNPCDTLSSFTFGKALLRAFALNESEIEEEALNRASGLAKKSKKASKRK